MENTGVKDVTLYYKIDYTLSEVPSAAAYFHAQYRHADPIGPGGIYTILDDVMDRANMLGPI